MWTRNFAVISLLLVAVAAVAAQVQADWPQWRGPRRDGAATGLDLADAEWPAHLEKSWRVELGGGYSSPIVVDGRVFVHSRDGKEEVVTAFDLSDGKPLWSDRYPAPFNTNSYAGGHGRGPYATPLVDAGRLYTLGVNATLSAYDAATGELLWRKEPTGGSVDSSKLFCGAAGSPLLVDGALIVHVGDDRGGRVLALEAGSGEQRWEWRGDGPGYASPVVAELDGTRQIITLSDRSVFALELASGKLLWRIDFPDDWNENVVTPLVHGESVLYSGVRAGTFAVRPRKGDSGWILETLWERHDLTMYLSSPVLVDGAVLGMSNKLKGHLFKADPSSGETLWQGEGRLGHSASLITAGSTLLVTTTDGVLQTYDLRGADPVLTATYELAAAAVYAHPAIAGGKLLLRDKAGLTAWRLPTASD